MIKVINDLKNILDFYLGIVTNTIFVRSSKITLNILMLYLINLICDHKESSVTYYFSFETKSKICG